MAIGLRPIAGPLNAIAVMAAQRGEAERRPANGLSQQVLGAGVDLGQAGGQGVEGAQLVGDEDLGEDGEAQPGCQGCERCALQRAPQQAPARDALGSHPRRGQGRGSEPGAGGDVGQPAGPATATGKTLTWSEVHGAARVAAVHYGVTLGHNHPQRGAIRGGQPEPADEHAQAADDASQSPELESGG